MEPNKLEILLAKIEKKDKERGEIDPPIFATVTRQEYSESPYHNPLLIGVDLILLSWTKMSGGKIYFRAIPATPPFYGGRTLIRDYCVEFKES